MINPALRGPLFGVSPTCEANLEAPFIAPSSAYLTSSYFGAQPQLHLNKPAGKYSHGGLFDRDARGREGICKDTQSNFMSPHWYNHQEAAKLAELATIQYLDDLTQDLCPDVELNNCPRLRLLWGLGPTLTFTIDTTGRMGSIIYGVRSDAIQIVNERRRSDDAPLLYVLARCNGPVLSDAQTFTNDGQFIVAIASLTAGEGGSGGDCPELAMDGLQHAIEASSASGQIFL